jgi:hypothetical protein
MSERDPHRDRSSIRRVIGLTWPFGQVLLESLQSGSFQLAAGVAQPLTGLRLARAESSC